jgi:hypothetical protein
VQILTADKDRILYTRGETDEILVVLNLSMNKLKVDNRNQRDKILLQTKPDDVQIEDSNLTLAPLGGAILSK